MSEIVNNSLGCRPDKKSVGVHSLKEKDCLAYFETVKVGIELILDEKLEEFKKKLKIEEAKKKLATVASKVSKK
ncbi:hypothetical protein [Tenacibaculum mesophilum]|uniref:hypothetical protein n=1 Tax=Tenacibaculum mesophilum TaxID=104268 RepID=UPI003747B333